MNLAKLSLSNLKVWKKHLERILKKKAELDKLRPIPGYAMKSIKESLMLEWTYNSNSIEGNTLTLHETKMVIEEGFTIKGKSLREHFEAINHQEAIEFVESLISDKDKFKQNRYYESSLFGFTKN